MASRLTDYDRDQLTQHFEQQDLDTLVGFSAAKGEERDTFDDEKRVIDKVLLGKLATAGFLQGQSYIRDDGLGVNIQARTTRTIDRAKLILKGIDPAVVDECTTETVSAPYLVTQRPKAKK